MPVAKRRDRERTGVSGRGWMELCVEERRAGGRIDQAQVWSVATRVAGDAGAPAGPVSVCGVKVGLHDRRHEHHPSNWGARILRR
jgi:hypothetical protein